MNQFTNAVLESCAIPLANDEILPLGISMVLEIVQQYKIFFLRVIGNQKAMAQERQQATQELNKAEKRYGAQPEPTSVLICQENIVVKVDLDSYSKITPLKGEKRILFFILLIQLEVLLEVKTRFANF